jgi:hypothetical protein
MVYLVVGRDVYELNEENISGGKSEGKNESQGFPNVGTR